MFYIAPKLNIHFMNLGYSPAGLEDEKIVKHFNKFNNSMDQESDETHLYLYEKALSFHQNYPTFTSMSLLEVSCGQGYSLDWIRKTHSYPEVFGIDKIANKEKGVICSDAHRLPFANNTFDIVLNVEASHLYNNFPKFLKECHRVLKPNGTLCWIDIRYANEMEKCKNEISGSGFTIEKWIDVTSNVLNGIRITSQYYDQLLDMSPVLIKIFSESFRKTYCAPGTPTYKRLIEREKVYICGHFKAINK